MIRRAHALVLVLFFTSGCATQSASRKQLWKAPPRIEWHQLTTQPVSPVENDYRILDDAQTQGRFPCAMSVSRMAVSESEVPGAPALILPATPHNEFLIWNNMFDNLPAISEAFPVVERNLGEYPADPALIVSTARAFHAGLCLIYAANQPEENRFEMMGVVHDTDSGRPIAVIHASTMSRPRSRHEKKVRNNVDAWEREARALTRAEFRKKAVLCLRELIARDVPRKVDAPEGWRHEFPVPPIVWPPIYQHP